MSREPVSAAMPIELFNEASSLLRRAAKHRLASQHGEARLEIRHRTGPCIDRADDPAFLRDTSLRASISAICGMHGVSSLWGPFDACNEPARPTWCRVDQCGSIGPRVFRIEVYSTFANTG